MNWPASDADIVDAIIAREGGFVDDPSDPGGATRYGITIATYAAFKGHPVTAADIETMPMSDAVAIYTKQYIGAPGFDAITDLHIRSVVVDTGVLFGPARAVQFLQGAVGVPVNGIMGPATVAAVNNFSDPRAVCNSIAVQRVKYHGARVQAHPEQLHDLGGWLARATSFIE